MHQTVGHATLSRAICLDECEGCVQVAQALRVAATYQMDLRQLDLLLKFEQCFASPISRAKVSLVLVVLASSMNVTHTRSKNSVSRHKDVSIPVDSMK